MNTASSLRKWRKIEVFFAVSEMVRCRFRKIMLAADREWVGEGEEAGTLLIFFFFEDRCWWLVGRAAGIGEPGGFKVCPGGSECRGRAGIRLIVEGVGA